MVFWVFCAAMSATYLLRISAQHVSTASSATCLAQFNQHQSLAPPFWDRPQEDAISMMRGDGADADTFQAMDQALREVRASDPFFDTYIRAAMTIPDLELYLCESDELSIGKRYNGQYTPVLRRASFARLLFADHDTLMRTLRHELCHTACHAWQLSYDENSDSTQPFLNDLQRQTLEDSFKAGKIRLQKMLETYDPKSTQDNPLKNAFDRVKHLYGCWQYKLYASYNDPFYATLMHTFKIFNDEWNARSVYSTKKLLSERIAFLLGEVPLPIVQHFVPNIYDHMDAMAKEVLVRNNISTLYRPLIRSTFYCRNEPVDQLFNMPFRAGFIKADDLPMFLKSIDKAMLKKDQEALNAAPKVLLDIINRGLVSDENQKSDKQKIYFYLSQLAGLAGDKKAEEKYFKRSEKIRRSMSFFARFW